MKPMARTFIALLIAVTGTLLACSNHARTNELIVYEASDGSATNIYTISPAGTGAHQLTFGTSFDGNPAWSPDRRKIIFSSDRGGAKNDLYVMDAGGRGARRVPGKTEGSELSPKVSSERSVIAYLRAQNVAG